MIECWVLPYGRSYVMAQRWVWVAVRFCYFVYPQSSVGGGSFLQRFFDLLKREVQDAYMFPVGSVWTGSWMHAQRNTIPDGRVRSVGR